MNYMKQVAQMLGVELGEEFKLKDYNGVYKLTIHGLYYLIKYGGVWVSDDATLAGLVRGACEIIKLPKPILDEAEKEYLSYVIKPFRDKVASIRKIEYATDREFICIEYHEPYERVYSMVFPSFKKGTMYKGMEFGKKYTLKDLGL